MKKFFIISIVALLVLSILLCSSGIFASGTFIVRGDANKNKQLNMADVTTIERMILGLSVMNQEADANGNGVVDMGDVVKVERMILGMDIWIGDVDGNLIINQDDVTKLERMILGLEPTNAQADVNQDGKVSIGDITALELMLAD